MENRHGLDRGSSRILRAGQGGRPQPRPASGATPSPASTPANPSPARPASGPRAVKQDERPSTRRLAPGGLSAPLPSRQPPARPSSAPEKKGDTQLLRKSSGRAPAVAPPSATVPDRSGKASDVAPPSAPRSSSSRIARLTASSSRATDAAARPAENNKPETSTLAFKLKFAMLASIPVMLIAAVLLYFFGPKGGVIEDPVWKEVAADFEKLQREIESYRGKPEEERPTLFGNAVGRLRAILERAEAHYQKKRSENPDLDLSNAEEFITKTKKTVEWMSKYREWGDMRVKTDDLFEEYKLAVSTRELAQKKTALERVLNKYKELQKEVAAYKDDLQKRYEINPWFVQEVLDTIGININDIENAIVKVEKQIETAQQGGPAGGDDELKPLDRSRPTRRGPLKPEEEQLLIEAKRAVERAKSMFKHAMRERDSRKRTSLLQDACNELVPAFKTYRDLWEAYKDKGEDYAFLEYEMDDVRHLDQQFKNRMRTHR